MGNKATMPDLKVETATITPGESAKVLHKGVIKYYENQRGFGFLTDSDSGIDYFYHATGIVNHQPITSGDLVEFVLGEHDGKVLALQLNRI